MSAHTEAEYYEVRLWGDEKVILRTRNRGLALETARAKVGHIKVINCRHNDASGTTDKATNTIEWECDWCGHQWTEPNQF